MKSVHILFAMAITLASSAAFVVELSSSKAAASTQLSAKGFGSKPDKKEKSSGAIQREQESSRYDDIAQAGGQEYSIFVRQFGSDDKSWLPCGSIAVPRGAQVSDAIYANEDALRKAIVRTFVKLKGFEEEFEYGYNLKVYPDDPIEVAFKSTSKKSSGWSVTNWVNTLLSPIDASKISPSTPPAEEK
jgi:hypothetical protein